MTFFQRVNTWYSEDSTKSKLNTEFSSEMADTTNYIVGNLIYLGNKDSSVEEVLHFMKDYDFYEIDDAIQTLNNNDKNSLFSFPYVARAYTQYSTDSVLDEQKEEKKNASGSGIKSRTPLPDDYGLLPTEIEYGTVYLPGAGAELDKTQYSIAKTAGDAYRKGKEIAGGVRTAIGNFLKAHFEPNRSFDEINKEIIYLPSENAMKNLYGIGDGILLPNGKEMWQHPTQFWISFEARKTKQPKWNGKGQIEYEKTMPLTKFIGFPQEESLTLVDSHEWGQETGGILGEIQDLLGSELGYLGNAALNFIYPEEGQTLKFSIDTIDSYINTARKSFEVSFPLFYASDPIKDILLPIALIRFYSHPSMYMDITSKISEILGILFKGEKKDEKKAPWEEKTFVKKVMEKIGSHLQMLINNYRLGIIKSPCYFQVVSSNSICNMPLAAISDFTVTYHAPWNLAVDMEELEKNFAKTKLKTDAAWEKAYKDAATLALIKLNGMTGVPTRADVSIRFQSLFPSYAEEFFGGGFEDPVTVAQSINRFIDSRTGISAAEKPTQEVISDPEKKVIRSVKEEYYKILYSFLISSGTQNAMYISIRDSVEKLEEYTKKHIYYKFKEEIASYIRARAYTESDYYRIFCNEYVAKLKKFKTSFEDKTLTSDDLSMCVYYTEIDKFESNLRHFASRFYINCPYYINYTYGLPPTDFGKTHVAKLTAKIEEVEKQGIKIK